MRSRLGPVVALLLSFGAATTAGAQTPEAAFTTVEVISVPSVETLLGVSFADAQHGWAVGGYGVIVGTSDGGKTWVRQRSGVEAPIVPGQETVSLFGVSFTDSRHGWAVGDPDLILSTADGGATWTKHDPPPINEKQGPSSSDGRASKWSFSGVKFTDAQSGHLVGAGGAILATTDGGNTWVWQGDGRYGRLTGLSFPDPAHGRAVGEGRPSFVMIATADGGSSWTIDPGGDPGGQIARSNFRAVSFTDPLRGHVASDAGRIFATTDGGRHWAVQRKDTTETFYGLAFRDARRGVAVGYTEFSDGRKSAIVTTGDGGETWVARPVPGAILWDVAFASPTTAFAVGCAEAPPADQKLPCQKSLIVKITFPDAAGGGSSGGGGAGGGGGGFAIPVPFLVGGALLAAALGAILVVRRQPRSGRH